MGKTGKVRKKYSLASRIIAFVLLLLISGAIALFLPPVQKAIGAKASEAISKNLDGRLDCKEIIILPFNSVLLKNVTLTDAHPYVSTDPERPWHVVDTVLRAGTITAGIRLGSLITGGPLMLTRIHIDDAYVIRVVEPAPRRTRHGESVMNNISRILRSNPDKPQKEKSGETIRIRKIKLSNFSFSQYNYDKEQRREYESGINWLHFGFTAGSALVKNLSVTDRHCTGFLKLSSVSELEGYRLNSLSCSFNVSGQNSVVTDINIDDGMTLINYGELEFKYDNQLAFRSFNDEVDMALHLRNSRIDTRTLNQFCGRRVFEAGCLDIQDCRYSGYAHDFSVSNLSFSSSGGEVNATIDLSMCKAADGGTGLNCEVKRMQFTPKGLTSFISTISKKPVNAEFISGNAPCSLQASLSGSLKELDCKMLLSQSGGSTSANLTIRNIKDSSPISIEGALGLEDMDVGKLIGKAFVGKVNLNTDLKCILQKDNPVICAWDIKSDGFSAIGHDFNGLTGNITYANHEADAKIVIDDPALSLNLEGSMNLSERGKPRYDVFASIRKADLSIIKFIKREIFLSADISASTGRIYISDIALEDNSFSYPVGSADVRLDRSEGVRTISVSSDVIDIDYKGEGGFGSMLKDLKAVTTGMQLPSLNSEKTEMTGTGNYHLYSDIKHPRTVLPHFLPAVYFSDSTEFCLDINSGIADVALRSQRLAVGSEYVKGINLSFNNRNDRLCTSLSADEIKIRELLFKNPILNAAASHDSLSTSFHYDVDDDTQESSDIFLNASLSRDRNDSLRITAHIMPSGLVIGDKYWDIYDSDIIYDGETMKFTDLRMLSGNQFITLDGGISKRHKDTLNLKVNELGLTFANKLDKGEHNISGTLNAYAIVASPISDGFNLIGKADIDTLKVGGQDIGAVKASAAWDKSTGKIAFLGKNLNQGKELLSLRGSYTPNERSIDASLAFDDFETAGLSPFLDNIFKSIDGHVNGYIDMGVKDGAFNLRSRDTRLDSVKVVLRATDASYTLDGPFHMSGDTLRLDNVTVNDPGNGSGVLDGHVIINRNKQTYMDIRAKLDQLDILDKQAGSGSSIHGKMAVNCDAHIHGNINDIKVEAEASTSGPGNLHVSVAQGSGDKNSDLLSFKERERYIDPYEALLESLKLKNKKSASKMSIHADIGINPETEAIIELDRQGGNILTASGSGRIRYDMNSATGEASLNGIYTIDNGKVRLSLLGNLINRNFTIRKGGYMKFNGDLYNSDIDVTAEYVLKTSISTLIADTTSITSRKKVICGLNISNKITSPQISFSIDIPDLDPSTKSRVETALNTEDKVQKQFVSLLVTGNFIQDEQGGVFFNQSNILYKNLYDIVSGQLNNILQKLDIPLDLGLNYIESNTGQNAFDVAVSTQLFNNRVIVNGSFGNRGKKVTSSDPDVVGNIDIEVKIDKKGELRFTLFSHSPDAYTNWLDKSQRNGIGLTYQKEYDSLRQFFKSLFLKKEERDEIELERKRNMVKNRKVIKVE